MFPSEETTKPQIISYNSDADPPVFSSIICIFLCMKHLVWQEHKLHKLIFFVGGGGTIFIHTS